MFFSRPAPAPTIRFTCAPEDHGVISPPIPARSYLPDWFRKLPPVTESVASETNSGLTVKRCMPFLDAMTTGWIIPLPATVRLNVAEDGAKLTAGWDFDRTLVSFHGEHQVAGHPRTPRPPAKFHNFWTIATPLGWSCLFLSPLNRPNGIFDVAAGIVDTDTYPSTIHFPFFCTAEDGFYEIQKGSPMVQVIPFRRDAAELAADIRAATPAEQATDHRIQRLTKAATGWYRTEARAKR